MADWLFTTLTWVDGVLALLLPVLYIVWSRGFRYSISAVAYRWTFVVGFVLCMAWWYLLIQWFRTPATRGVALAVDARAILPATVLGVEAGVAGFLGLARLWSLLPLLFSALNALVGLEVFLLVLRARQH